MRSIRRSSSLLWPSDFEVRDESFGGEEEEEEARKGLAMARR